MKLLELERRLSTAPEFSRNPVAMIVRIHLAAKRHAPDSAARRRYKRKFLVELGKAIREQKLDVHERDDIRRLLALIDGFLLLSAESDKLFKEELEQDEEIKEMKKEMPFLTTFERWAVEEERQRTEEERQRAEEERQRADEERQRAEKEHQRAEQAAQRAEQAEQRAKKLAAKLSELGIDPDA